jgi:hypothetical protein
MFCASGLVLGCTEDVGSRFYVWQSRTHFRRYRGHYDPFSCLALPNSFEAVLRVSGPVYMFCPPGHVFDITEGVGFRLHILRFRTRFRRYRGRRVPFSYFALPDSFWAVPRASCPIFQVLRSQTHFGRYRWHRVPFSCFALPNSFFTKLRASGPVFMFCAPEAVLGGTDGVGSRFHVLCSLTRIGRYRGHRVQFSCFALPDTFWALPRTSSPTVMYCVPGLISVGIEGVGSRFHVLSF